MTLQKIREALESIRHVGDTETIKTINSDDETEHWVNEGAVQSLADEALALLDQMPPVVSREEFMNAVHDERSKCEMAARESTYWARWAYDFLASRTVVDFPSEEEMQEIAIDLAARSGDYIRESLTALFNRIKTVSAARSEGEK
jgi:hypothetical protein